MIDWNNAISMLIDLDRLPESTTLAQKTIDKYPSSSYTWYLLAKAYAALKDTDKARAADITALKIDPENADAKRLLTEINH
jgi:cytochrome c-type biogenesis protein CcmH/NrfG